MGNFLVERKWQASDAQKGHALKSRPFDRHVGEVPRTDPLVFSRAIGSRGTKEPPVSVRIVGANADDLAAGGYPSRSGTSNFARNAIATESRSFSAPTSTKRRLLNWFFAHLCVSRTERGVESSSVPLCLAMRSPTLLARRIGVIERITSADERQPDRDCISEGVEKRQRADDVVVLGNPKQLCMARMLERTLSCDSITSLGAPELPLEEN